MKKYFIATILITLFITIGFFMCKQKPKGFVYIPQLEIPTMPTKTIIMHSAYSFTYNEKHELSDWVAYELTSVELEGDEKRTNEFREDTSVSTGTANKRDYEKSGYDRGHLAPAADMKFSKIAMNESFYFSNIAPQVAGFNRGIWRKLEENVRKWALKYDTLYIITGPLLTDNLQTIGENEVSIPEYFYKTILCYTSQHIAGIGFVMPNKKSNSDIFEYAVTIDSVESLLKIDLYDKLPDDIEKKVEKEININDWK
jgi:endonuclease G, mitochondrial